MTTAVAFKPNYCLPCYVKRSRRTTLWVTLMDGTQTVVIDDKPHRIEINYMKALIILTCGGCETTYNLPLKQ